MRLTPLFFGYLASYSNYRNSLLFPRFDLHMLIWFQTRLANYFETQRYLYDTCAMYVCSKLRGDK